jgi:TrpR-related protein YerC/YecD
MLDEFWTMVALLENKDEVKSFFKDLLSASESVMLARRIQIAKLLLSGWGYDRIETKLGTGPTTIASVHRWLQGGYGGYMNAIPKLKREIERREKVMELRQEEGVPLSSAWMRKKYPLHYLLVNIMRGDEDLTPPRKLRQ